MINTDSYYEIGSGHVFNQDYAGSGEFTVGISAPALQAGLKKFRYAAVADGCSGSQDSDFGARCLVKFVPAAIQEAFNLAYEGGVEFHTLLESVLVKFLQRGMFDLGLRQDAYDATLVLALYDVDSDIMYSFIFGDGKVLVKGKNGIGYLSSINFPSNAPYYLNYHTSIERAIRYDEVFGTKYGTFEFTIIRDDASIPVRESLKFGVKSNIEVIKDFAKTEFTSISVFTDGVDTFHKKDDSDIMMPLHTMMNQLTQFKGSHGEFVKRRMNGVKKFCDKEAWQHFDDISIATITLV